MYKALIIIAALFLGLPHNSSSKPTVIVSSRPMELIVKQIAGIRAKVINIAPDSVLPWLYKPSAADILRARAADVVIISSLKIEKWAAGLSDIKPIICMDLLPDEFKIKVQSTFDSTSSAKDSLTTQEYNPFFWTDPLTVKEIVYAIADTLASADPDYAASYTINAGLFATRLDLLDRQASQKLAESNGKPLIFFDRSLEYFARRYNLINAACFANEIFGNKINHLDSVLRIVKDIEAKFVFYTNYSPDFIISMVSGRTRTNKIILNPLAIETMKERASKGVTKNMYYSDLILNYVRKLRLGLE